MLVSFGFGAKPASADCAADIVALEAAFGSQGGKGGQSALKAAKRLVEKAKVDLAAGKKKACAAKVEKAKKKIQQ